MVSVHIVTVKKLYENIWICRDDGRTLDYFHKLDHFKSLTDGDGLSSVAEKLIAVQGPDLVNPYPVDIQGRSPLSSSADIAPVSSGFFRNE